MTYDVDNFHTVMDGAGKTISVGTRVLFALADGDALPATVFEITDPDADYDDTAQRGVLYPPKVKVRFHDGTEDEAATSLSWQSPAEMQFTCDDVEVA